VAEANALDGTRLICANLSPVKRDPGNTAARTEMMMVRCSTRQCGR
jgi:hypothetical protein